MQKINKIIFIFLISVHVLPCSGSLKYTKIFEDKDYKISFVDSKKMGKRIKCNLLDNNKAFEYNIHIGYKGLPIHIIKYDLQLSNSQDRLNIYRGMEFLVSDTAKNNLTYLNNGIDINDYYDPAFFKGNYEVEKLKKKINHVSVKEYKMFQKIFSILANKKIEFQPIDSTKIIGWFRYDF